MKVTPNTTGIEYWDGITDAERLALFTSNDEVIPTFMATTSFPCAICGKSTKAFGFNYGACDSCAKQVIHAAIRKVAQSGSANTHPFAQSDGVDHEACVHCGKYKSWRGHTV